MKNLNGTKIRNKLNLDLEYFLKGSFWFFLLNLTTILKSLIISYFFANFTTKNFYGEYTFIIAILNFTLIFSLPGLTNIVSQSLSKKYDLNYYKSFKKIFKYSFLGSLFLFLSSIYFYFIGDLPKTQIFIALILLFPFYSITPLYGQALIGKKKIKELTLINIIYNIISTIIISLLILKTIKLNLLIIITLLFQIIYQGYYSLFYIKKYLKNKRYNKEEIVFGMKNNLNVIIDILNKRFDVLITTYFLGFENLAIYTISLIIPMTIYTFLNSTLQISIPKINKYNLNKKHIVLIFILTIPFFISSLFLSKFLIPILYENYYSSINYAFLNSFYILFIPISILSYNLYKKLEYKKILKNNLIYSVTYIFMGTILIIKLGIMGIIIAKQISLLVKFLHIYRSNF